MSDSPGTDERTVERALRDILEPLDRQLARVNMLFPLAFVTVVPAVFFLQWKVPADGTVRHSLVIAGGVCCALIALYLCLEILAARVARWRFDRRFPPSAPGRALALKILMEMETPSKAEDTLRSALAVSSPDRIVRHRKSVSDELPAQAPEQPIATGEPDPTPRPGGYYDYIPLEPRPRDDALPNDRRG